MKFARTRHEQSKHFAIHGYFVLICLRPLPAAFPRWVLTTDDLEFELAIALM